MDPEKLSLSIEQANAVLKLQLGQLTRLNKDKLANEKETLNESSKKLNDLMENDVSVRRVMVEEFIELKNKFGVPRKTKIEREESELNDIDLIENARNVIVVTRGGYIKRMPLKTFENQGRGTRGKKGTSNSSSDDEVVHCFSCNDHDTLLMTTQRGIAYGLRAFQVPEGSRIAKGVPIPSVLPVKIDDVITSVLPVSEFSKDEYCVLATKQGWIKKTPLAAFENISSRGLTIASLGEGDVLKWCQKCGDSDDILIGTTDGMASRFQASTLRPTGRTSRGVKAIKLKKGDTLADVNVLGGDQSTEYVLVVTACGYGKRIKTDEFTARARGGVGVMATKFKKGLNDRLSCLRAVNEDDEVLVITSKGVIVRQKVSAISSQSRAATGVLVQKVDTASGDFISSVSTVPNLEETEE
jgi:DNA gyrase subunit A